MNEYQLEIESTEGIENFRELVSFALLRSEFRCKDRGWRYSYNHADEYVTDNWTQKYIGNTRCDIFITLYSVDGKRKLILMNELRDFLQ